MLNRQYKTLNTIRVNSQQLIRNYHYFQSINSHTIIAPVVKSNAYGHGLVKVASLIDSQINPPFICVDSLYEAYLLKKSRIKSRILILGYTFPDNYQTLRRLPFSFPVYDLDTLRSLSKYQSQANVHIKIDTGMNRLGLQLNQIPDFIKELKQLNNLNLEGIYSHLSQADNTAKKTFTQKQITKFKQAIQLFKQSNINFTWRHITATSAATYINDPEFNLSRIGLGFYGHSPFSRNSNYHRQLAKNITPALKLTTHLVQVKRVGQGNEISYGGIYVTKKPATIGIIPMGYYDGIDRRLSNTGVVTVNRVECPILGRVCMNLTIIDVSKVNNPHIGQEVTLISNRPKDPNSLQTLANLCDTIPYDLLVNLSPSTKRIFT